MGDDIMKLTPMMEQYMQIKKEHPDSILFFRLGDFYEMFFDDAILASKELEIALTQRDAGFNEKAPMCGIPYHVVDNYIGKLIDKGYKVAICEQLEDPSTAKGIVKRGIIKIITPGTFVDSSDINNRNNRYIMGIFVDDFTFGLTYIDYSTGEIYSTEYSGQNCIRLLINEIVKINPQEVIINELALTNDVLNYILKDKLNAVINKKSIDDINNLSVEYTQIFSDERFKMISNNKIALISFQLLYSYIKSTQMESLNHLKNINYYDIDSFMNLDYNTRVNLELLSNLQTGKKQGALIGVLDRTRTSIGARLLKKWLEMPLKNINKINERLNYVEVFYNDRIILDDVRDEIRNVYDIDRLITRIQNKKINPRELICLKNSLSVLPKLIKLCSDNNILKNLTNDLDFNDDIYNIIKSSINEDATVDISDGEIIKSGYSTELDDLRTKKSSGRQFLIDLELKEKEKTGIKNLKVKYNKILGYYIDVTKSNLDMVPDYFIRKQTLVGSERYFTHELKQVEDDILHSNERTIAFEKRLYYEIVESLEKYVDYLDKVSHFIANIDVLCSFAIVSFENNYIKPIINNEGEINIKDARHPVVEKNVKNASFVPNDIYLNDSNQTIEIITGPNMSGKSTYMRQVAVIVLMSHCGCFVPASFASISLVDAIFTRIGASDNLSEGESTFMVEMKEVSNIIENATDKSLIILDEVGRGTSTYDGLSIAWAIVEHISKTIKAKTMFATHYHELTNISEELDNVVNKTILVEERNSEIIFLRKIVDGATNKSYGIEVAKLAGIKPSILSRAEEVLDNIENYHYSQQSKTLLGHTEVDQINLTSIKRDKLIDYLKGINIDNLTPLDALVVLNELMEKAKRI